MTQNSQYTYTKNFPKALRQLGISIVASTYQAGQLLVLRHDNGELNTHLIAIDKPMGMALTNNCLSVGTRSQVWDYFNFPEVAPKLEPQGKYDACFIPRAMHVTGDIDIHEMAFDTDQRLWLINTKMSCLCTLNKKYSIVPEWRPHFISGLDLTDRCHLNGLAMKDGKVNIVSALGTTDTPGGWRNNKATGGMLMDINSGNYIAQGLSMPHSPRWYRNKLWVLESGVGTLAEVNPATGELDVIVELPGFTRGLSFIGKYAIIGLSQVRETAVFAGLPLTKRVAERQCGIWIVDIEQRKIVAWLSLSNQFQEIFSVQAFSARFPSFLDLNDPRINTSYSLPSQAVAEVTPPDQLQQKMELAITHHQQNELDEAIRLYQEIIKEQPENVNAWSQLGLAYGKQEKWTDAVDSYQQVIDYQPSNAVVHNSLGHTYARLGEYQLAINSYSNAITYDKKYAHAYYNRGLINLRLGNYKDGWKDYAWRTQRPNFSQFECPLPVWQGESIANKTLLVYSEHRNSDAILYARFLAEVKKRCKRLLLVCAEPLRQLFQAIDTVDEVYLPEALPPDSFATYIPLEGLAGILNTTVETIPQKTPYLAVPSQIQVPPLKSDSNFKVGLVWDDNNTDTGGDKNDCCPFNEMMRLTDIAGIDFYSLQLPLASEQRQRLKTYNVHDLEAELVSYAHTAAYLEQLDLVISIDTAVAHLSGALNIPTWLLLAPYGRWQWMVDIESSPWYPSMRLFRQKQTSNWPELITLIHKVLSEEFSTHR